MKRGETFENVLERRFERRQFLKGAAGAILLAPVIGRADPTDHLDFQPIPASTLDAVLVPPGYVSQVVLRWGDPILPGASPLNLLVQSPETQSKQFGFNCDFLAFFPLSPAQSSKAGLLAVNHEFTDGLMMFPSYVPNSPTRNEVDVEIAAHGVSIVQIEDIRGQGWTYHPNSQLNRRITGETEIRITGPALGHPWLQTSYDSTGTLVRGTLNNCAGGKTPWGTMLTGEENFNQYFANRGILPNSDPRKNIHSRYGIASGASTRRWELYHDRFNVGVEPNEPFRFGWVVEIDPYDPASIPKKRTALGRTKHEGATTVLARDGRVVVYSGDDERFDYMYKFVSSGRYNPAHRAANMDLLDSGVLYVARFESDGTGEWIPLVGGEGPLAAWSHEEVLLNTRGAADVVGATKMDRPEDIETNPVNGKVYAVMTNNTNRGTAGNPGTDAANPRAVNRHGHIIELTERGDDAASETFTWDIFLLCGDPSNPADQTYFAGFDPRRVSTISTPDNIAFDKRGNLWIATDGQPGTIQKNDGVFAVPADGQDRGFLRQFMSSPVGAEVCGPEFTPDNETLFCAIQHPGEGGRISQPTSHWPDGGPVARPSVIAITKTLPGPKTIGT
jgi:secreted PhoX family phosphatase